MEKAPEEMINEFRNKLKTDKQKAAFDEFIKEQGRGNRLKKCAEALALLHTNDKKIKAMLDQIHLTKKGGINKNDLNRKVVKETMAAFNLKPETVKGAVRLRELLAQGSKAGRNDPRDGTRTSGPHRTGGRE